LYLKNSNNYLDQIEANNVEFSKSLIRSRQKNKGQYITPNTISDYMASRYVTRLTNNGSKINILDPGAGTGVLGISAVIKIFEKCPNIKINLVAYEIDVKAIYVLKKNLTLLDRWTEENNYQFEYKIRQRDYILEEKSIMENNIGKYENYYDFIISNPPYKKIKKNDPYVDAIPFIVYGAPNKYSFFLTKSIIELKPNALMIYLIPRSWMSGNYFKLLRKFIFNCGSIVELHSFDNRNNQFGNTMVLQELVILVFKKGYSKKITYYNHDNIEKLNNSSSLSLDQKSIKLDDEYQIYTLTNKEQLDIINHFKYFNTRFKDLGLKMHTGTTVKFRNIEYLYDSSSKFNVPLFCRDNFQDHKVVLNDKNKQYISLLSHTLQKNEDYIFVKRFSTKEEKRRINVAYYRSNLFNEYNLISTDNKINFVSCENKDILKGAFLVLASTQFDKYYRALNGNTQVNSTEINNMYFLNDKILEELSSIYDIDEILNFKQSKIDMLINNIFNKIRR